MASSDPYAGFSSARLIYRAIEENEADDDFIDRIQKNPSAVANSSAFLHRPQSKAMSMKGYRRALHEDSLLAVFICLKPGPGFNPSVGADSETAGDQQPPKPIGIIALDLAGQNHRHHRDSDIGIDIAGPYQGQGYGTEAIEWVLRWAFVTAGLHRVGISAFSYNAGALRLYERLGFVVEGRKRENIWYQGGWHDGVWLSMLEHEWRDREAKRQKEGGWEDFTLTSR